MAFARNVYNLLFRRTSTFAITIMVGAVFFERVFDQAGDAVFDNMNGGNFGNTSNTIMRKRRNKAWLC